MALCRSARLGSIFGGLARGARAVLGAPPPRAPLLCLAMRQRATAPCVVLAPSMSMRELMLGDSAAAGARAAAGGAEVQRAAAALLPALTAAWTLLPDLMPTIVQVGKKSHRGKNKRMPKKANHGARPCSHVMRRRRAACIGRIKARFK